MCLLVSVVATNSWRDTMKTKQPKTYIHGTKLILSRQERITHEKDTNYYLGIGYSQQEAEKRADDHLMITRQVKAGSFRSKW